MRDAERRLNELEAHLHTLETQHAWYGEIVYHAVMVYSRLWLFAVLCLYVVAYPDRWPLAMFVWYVALVPAVNAL